MRCARCDHVWMADPNKKKRKKEEIYIPEAPQWKPPSSSIAAAALAPVPPSRIGQSLRKTKETLAKIAWDKVAKGILILSGGCLIGALIFILLGKETVIRHWPETQIYYKMAGLIAPPQMEKLALQKVRSERRYMDGAMHLVVTGDIRNQAKKTQILPPILVEALGPDGQLIQSWHIDPPAATLPPGRTASFASAIISPEGTVVEVNLSFVEPPHDQP